MSSLLSSETRLSGLKTCLEPTCEKIRSPVDVGRQARVHENDLVGVADQRDACDEDVLVYVRLAGDSLKLKRSKTSKHAHLSQNRHKRLGVGGALVRGQGFPIDFQ